MRWSWPTCVVDVLHAGRRRQPARPTRCPVDIAPVAARRRLPSTEALRTPPTDHPHLAVLYIYTKQRKIIVPQTDYRSIRITSYNL